MLNIFLRGFRRSRLRTVTLLLIVSAILAARLLTIEEDDGGTPLGRFLLFHPQIDPKSFVIVEAETGRLLSGKSEHRARAPASLNKLLTTLILLDHCPTGAILTIPEHATMTVPILAGLVAGEQYPVSDLIGGMIAASANDAAVAVAYIVAETEADFANIMNDKARALGMRNSQFKNSVGFDDEDQYTTALDLARLSRAAIAQEEIALAAMLPEVTFRSLNGHEHVLPNTNRMIDRDGVKGLKTGTTPQARQNLILWVEQDARDYLIIILGSRDRYREAEIMLDWITRRSTPGTLNRVRDLLTGRPMLPRSRDGNR